MVRSQKDNVESKSVIGSLCKKTLYAPVCGFTASKKEARAKNTSHRREIFEVDSGRARRTKFHVAALAKRAARTK